MIALRAPAILAALLVGVFTHTARAFPPYRSTDAETADPWALEGRLGIIRLIRDQGENEYVSPLARVNFGLPYRVELVSELEYLPEHERLGDAAVGVKWVPFFEQLSLGIETLALLPVSNAGGIGVESSLLATQRVDDLRLHANVGGFYDARPEPIEKGWRAGLLGELKLERFHPGVELFAKQVVSEPVALQSGFGVIVDLGPLAVRAGMHVGLSAAAADIMTSLWVSSNWPLR